MRKQITGLSLMLTLLLAPLPGVLAAVCQCEPLPAEPEEMKLVSCCEDFTRCCYDQNQSEEATALLADLNQQSRDKFKVAVRHSVLLRPAPAAVVALERKMVRCADPPDTGARELSLRQSWLI